MSLDYLANNNKHKRDSNISFKDNGHIYTIKHPNCLDGDTGFTSVTTFIHSFIDVFDADKIINNMMNSSKWSNNKYYGLSKCKIIELWNKNGNDAACAGTKMHYDIECFYNNMKVVNNSVEYSYFINFYNNHKYLMPYRSEWIIYDEDLRLAGSIDMVFINSDNILEIYDWKRCKEIVKNTKWNKWMKNPIISHLPDTNFWHYSLQLNIYKAILIRKYGQNVGNLYLVCLHPDNNNNNYIKIAVPNLQTEVLELFYERERIIKINTNS